MLGLLVYISQLVTFRPWSRLGGIQAHAKPRGRTLQAAFLRVPPYRARARREGVVVAEGVLEGHEAVAHLGALRARGLDLFCYWQHLAEALHRQKRGCDVRKGGSGGAER